MSEPKVKLKFTPTEERILAVLSDGKPHLVDNLTSCLWDEYNVNPKRSIHFHICRIRAKIRPCEHDIATVISGGKYFYQHVLLIGPEVAASLTEIQTQC